MDRYEVARSRGALARLQVLRMEHRTRDAQSLWTIAAGGGLADIRFGRVTERQTPGAAFGEMAAIERAQLLMRQDDATRLEEAIKILDHCRARLLGTRSTKPVLEGDRQRRLVAKLSVAYSMAGREAPANALAAWILGASYATADNWATWDANDWRRVTADTPDIRAADQLGNISVRTARLASIEILDGSPESERRATALLRVAEATATVSLEKRRSDHGRGISRRALLNVELCRQRLDAASSLDRCEELAATIWEFVADAHMVPANGRAALMSRHALYGQALVDVARAEPERKRAGTARLARVAISPMATINELDATYDLSASVAYGDACALSGDELRARRSWAQVLSRLQRGRPEQTGAAESLERRLATGMPPLPAD